MTDENLHSHSQMLGQIANLVEDYCADGETTTYEAVKFILEELESENRWANHYCRKLMQARARGYLPEEFQF